MRQTLSFSPFIIRALNGNGFCVVTGDSKYIKKDTHLFSKSRLARKKHINF